MWVAVQWPHEPKPHVIPYLVVTETYALDISTKIESTIQVRITLLLNDRNPLRIPVKSSLEAHNEEQVFEKNVSMSVMVRHILEVRVVMKDVIEDVEEELQGKLVGMIDQVELLEDEEHRTASLRQGEVFCRHLLHFLSHNDIRFFHLVCDLCSLSLQRLQGANDLVILPMDSFKVWSNFSKVLRRRQNSP